MHKLSTWSEKSSLMGTMTIKRYITGNFFIKFPIKFLQEWCLCFNEFIFQQIYEEMFLKLNYLYAILHRCPKTAGK